MSATWPSWAATTACPDARPERRRISRAWFAALLAGAFFVLSFIGVLRHEPWRDEYQAWMVARDAATIPELFENVKYEGNPALRHFILFVVTRLSGDRWNRTIFDTWPGLVQVILAVVLFAVFAVGFLANACWPCSTSAGR